MRHAAMAVALLIAGCASHTPQETDLPPSLDELSKKVFSVLPVEELWVPASDGKGMHAAVFRPDTDQDVPVFINFSPYWGDTAAGGGDAFSRYMIDEYVPRGYAVVLAAVRGTGHSEGCFQIGGDRELQDLYDVVDFFAQAEWSNGKLAAGGKSYDSTSQNGMIAKYPHPALKGLFHVSGITDMYAYTYKGGVSYDSGPIFNGYYYLQGTDEYGASLVRAGSLEDEDAESLARLVDDVACAELPFIQAHGVGSAVTGMKSDYWIERDWTRSIGASSWNGSIFFVHGLQDWNVKPDHILPWIDDLPPQIRVKGWLHQDTRPGDGGHVYPMRTDWNHTLLAWLDAELKGKDTGIWDTPAWDVEATDGLWRQSDTWPPGNASSLQPQAVVSTDPPVLSFRFDKPTRMAGAPVLTVGATAATPYSVLTAIFEKNGEWIGEAVLRAMYRDSLDTPVLTAPGQETYELVAYPLEVVFDADDELTITLGAGARHSVTIGATGGVSYNTGTATLHAHFLPADAREDQPVPMPCIAC